MERKQKQIQKMISIILSILLVCGKTITAIYVFGKPIAEGAPEPLYKERLYNALTESTLDIVDVMNRGSFVVTATSRVNNFVIPMMTYHDVTYPINGSGTSYLVDVTTIDVSALPSNGSEMANYLTVGSRAIVELNKGDLAMQGNKSKRTFVALSEFHSVIPKMFGEVAVCGKDNSKPTTNDLMPAIELTYNHIIPGNVGVLSLQTFQLSTNDTEEQNEAINETLKQYSGSVKYTADLAGQYIPIMNAVASHAGTMRGWKWRCGRWNKIKREWNTENCNVIPGSRVNQTFLTCECSANGNKSSTYALLLSMGSRDDGLAWPIIIGCVILELTSLVSLLVAIVILLCLKNTIHACTERNRCGISTTIHINLCFALALLHLAMLLRPAAILSTCFCCMITILAHYFLLVSGSWMLIEGITLYRLTCGSDWCRNTRRQRRLFTFLSVMAWLAPAVIVGISAGFGFKHNIYLDESGGYRFMVALRHMLNPQTNELLNEEPAKYNRYSRCSLSPTMTYTAAVPIAVALIPNIVIAFIICVRVGKIKKIEHVKQPKRKNHCLDSKDRVVTSGSSGTSSFTKRSNPIVASVRAFLILLPVLGVPWIGTFVGVVPAAESTITVLHILASSLQGFLVAFAVCFVKSDVRSALARKVLAKYPRLGKSKISVFSTTT